MKKTDGQLQQDVVEELAAEGNLDASTIGVAVKGGTVELLGTVPSYAEKELADRVVRRVAGVRGIVNRLHATVGSRHSHAEAP